MEFLSYLNMTFIAFLIAEFILFSVFTKDWKFRLKRAKGHPQLKPFSKSWKILITFLFLTFIIAPLLITILFLFLPRILEDLGYLQIFILFFIFPIVYLWAKLRIVAKKGLSLWDIIPISTSIISLSIFLILILR